MRVLHVVKISDGPTWSAGRSLNWRETASTHMWLCRDSTTGTLPHWQESGAFRRPLTASIQIKRIKPYVRNFRSPWWAGHRN